MSYLTHLALRPRPAIVRAMATFRRFITCKKVLKICFLSHFVDSDLQRSAAVDFLSLFCPLVCYEYKKDTRCKSVGTGRYVVWSLFSLADSQALLCCLEMNFSS